MFRWLFGIVLTYRRWLFLILCLQICGGAMISASPLYFQRIVTLALSDNREPFSGERLLGGLALLLIGIALVQAVSGVASCRFSSNLLKDLQESFFKAVSHLPLNFFHQTSAGEFTTKFTHDIGQVQALISATFPQILKEGVTLIFAVILLLHACPAFLVVFALGMVICVSVSVLWLNRVLKRYALSQRACWERLNQTFDETIQGIDTIKTFAGEDGACRHFDRQTNRFRSLSVQAGTTTAVFSPLIDLLSRLGGLALIFIALLLIFRAQLFSEQFLIFFFYSGLLQASMAALVQMLSGIQFQLASAQRLADLFSEKPESADDPLVTLEISEALPIVFKHIDFAYPGRPPLFRGADLEIPERGTTLIRGPSGSGKSTLVNLLLKFCSPATGEILLGGRPLTRFSKAELRTKIGVVTQYTYIFQDTLKKNVSLSTPHAGDAEIRAVLEKALLGDFLTRLPLGLDEIMAPRGRDMSHGEKQRLGIARALLRKCPVIVLDEPWSSLDEQARNLLAQIVNRCKKEATVLILSHDLPRSLEVDRCYYIDSKKGKFVMDDAIFHPTDSESYRKGNRG